MVLAGGGGVNTADGGTVSGISHTSSQSSAAASADANTERRILIISYQGLMQHSLHTLATQAGYQSVSKLLLDWLPCLLQRFIWDRLPLEWFPFCLLSEGSVTGDSGVSGSSELSVCMRVNSSSVNSSIYTDGCSGGCSGVSGGVVSRLGVAVSDRVDEPSLVALVE